MDVNENVQGLATRLGIEPEEFIKIVQGEEPLDKIKVKHYLSDERYKEIEQSLSKTDPAEISKAINNNKEARWRKFRAEKGIESDHADFEDYVEFLKGDYLTQEIDKVKTELSGKPDERIDALNRTVAELQGTLKQKDEAHEAKINELTTQYAKRQSDTMLKEHISTLDINVPDYIMKRGESDAQKFVDTERKKLFKLLKSEGAELHKSEEGKTSIVIGGEEQVHPEYKTPTDPQEFITNYAKEMNITVDTESRKGRGGKDSKIKIATGLAKCTSVAEVIEYAKTKGISDRGDELSNLINEWKKLPGNK